ncbi:MAG: hypothetical protein IPG89_07250 [Bacteroidetes bacterium]|nr:hypothetical protein [Bacteroidota bacterium]
MYKIVKYQSEIASKDAETQKRYNLIEKLSKGFTIENEMAIQLDKLLVEWN